MIHKDTSTIKSNIKLTYIELNINSVSVFLFSFEYFFEHGTEIDLVLPLNACLLEVNSIENPWSRTVFLSLVPVLLCWWHSCGNPGGGKYASYLGQQMAVPPPSFLPLSLLIPGDVRHICFFCRPLSIFC
jgi:hypothetical protein